jgi:hypothetical protein
MLTKSKVSPRSKYRNVTEQYQGISYIKLLFGNTVEITTQEYPTDDGYFYTHLARFKLVSDDGKEVIFKARRYNVPNLGSSHYPLLPGQDEDGYGSRIEIGVVACIPIFGGDCKLYTVQFSNAGSTYVEYKDNSYFLSDSHLDFGEGVK